MDLIHHLNHVIRSTSNKNTLKSFSFQSRDNEVAPEATEDQELQNDMLIHHSRCRFESFDSTSHDVTVTSTNKVKVVAVRRYMSTNVSTVHGYSTNVN